MGISFARIVFKDWTIVQFVEMSRYVFETYNLNNLLRKKTGMYKNFFSVVYASLPERLCSFEWRALITISFRAFIRNLNLGVQSVLYGFQNPPVPIALRPSKFAGVKSDVPKIYRFVHPAQTF